MSVAVARTEAASIPDFQFNRILQGDAAKVLQQLPEDSVDLSFWSPPYFVGKDYEKNFTFQSWKKLLCDVIQAHERIIKPGGFMVINNADILCFADEEMPRFQANNIRGKQRCDITRETILGAKSKHPDMNRHELALLLGCSEQTIQRRLENNNVRGGKAHSATKIILTGCMLEQWAGDAGFYLYDKRIWHKDPCWANSQWHSNSYRAVDEFEHIYVFWKPGITEYDRHRLTPDEWADWGSRGVWQIQSVRRNDRHEAEFPGTLAERVIRLYSPAGGVVIDPFVGSGTTALVANKNQRQWLGIDISEQYVALARRRVELG